jgi:tetratricopeptide (TPR) repeat protein
MRLPHRGRRECRGRGMVLFDASGKTMQSRVVFVVGMAIGALAMQPAHGQPADALRKAQAAFDQAQSDFLQGKYDEAARRFQDAYDARPFPSFLYNVAATFHTKGKKQSDPVAYQKAIDTYRKYLAADPQATDKAKVEKAISVLEAEIKRLKAQPAAPGSGPNAGSAAPPAAPSEDVNKLEVKTRGLVVIESEPSNATVYLDDKRKGPFATTPWSGTLEGDHKVILEKRGYVVLEKTISADPTKLFLLSGAMAPASFLGWVEITSNVPGADIFIDDKAVGAVGKTPLSQNLSKGKHTFWISAEGYDETKQEVEVIANEVTRIKAQLKGSPVGKLNVTGLGIEDATISVDGKVLCERGPCLQSLPQGEHTITVTRPDFKSYSRRIAIQAKTETQIRVTLAPNPGRGDAIKAYVFAAVLGGGGVLLGLQANKYRDDLKKEIVAGRPPPDSGDPRFLKGKLFAIGADATFAIAGITALTAVYYTFREKGAPSTAMIDVRAVALSPQIGPGYAGLGMGGSW